MVGRIPINKNNALLCIYILQLSNNNLYTGSCSDLHLRLKEHKSGRVKPTHGFRPLNLIHYEAYKLKSDAQGREKFLKTTEGKRLLKQQIRDVLVEVNKTK